MQKLPYKIPALLLCGLLIYNSLGYFLVLSAMRIAVQHQNWSKISSVPDRSISIFVYDKNKNDSHIQIINSHEILVNGRLYDIIRTKEKGSEISFSCLYDKKEETLIAATRLLNTQSQQSPVHHTARLIIEKIIKTAIFNIETELLPEHSLSYFCLSRVLFYDRPSLQISLPPPQS